MAQIRHKTIANPQPSQGKTVQNYRAMRYLPAAATCRARRIDYEDSHRDGGFHSHYSGGCRSCRLIRQSGVDSSNQQMLRRRGSRFADQNSLPQAQSQATARSSAQAETLTSRLLQLHAIPVAMPVGGRVLIWEYVVPKDPRQEEAGLHPSTALARVVVFRDPRQERSQ